MSLLPLPFHAPQRALELIAGMVTRKNLTDCVQRLMENVENAEGAYRDALIEKIIFMCSRDKYEYLEDFAWYISTLIKLAYIQVRGAFLLFAALFSVLPRCCLVECFLFSVLRCFHVLVLSTCVAAVLVSVCCCFGFLCFAAVQCTVFPCPCPHRAPSSPPPSRPRSLTCACAWRRCGSTPCRTWCVRACVNVRA